jgi:hypothetical protein
MICVWCCVLVAAGFVPLSAVLGTLGSLRLLSILPLHSVCSRCFRFLALALHRYNSFCLLSAPLSIVPVLQDQHDLFLEENQHKYGVRENAYI